MSIVDIVLCIVFMNILGVSSESIECGQSITGKLEYYSFWEWFFSNHHLSVPIHFTNDHQQNVTMTTFDSESSAGLRLKNSTGHYIHSQSTNQCDGCGCDSPYCTGKTSLFQTTFTMEALPAGDYTIEVTNECGWDNNYYFEDFNLFVICEDDTTGLNNSLHPRTLLNYSGILYLW